MKNTVSEHLHGTVGTYISGCLDDLCHEAYEAMAEIGKEDLFDQVYNIIQEELNRASYDIYLNLEDFCEEHEID